MRWCARQEVEVLRETMAQALKIFTKADPELQKEIQKLGLGGKGSRHTTTEVVIDRTKTKGKELTIED